MKCSENSTTDHFSPVFTVPGAHEPPKAAKERVTPVPCKYKFVP